MQLRRRRRRRRRRRHCRRRRRLLEKNSFLFHFISGRNFPFKESESYVVVDVVVDVGLLLQSFER